MIGYIGTAVSDSENNREAKRFTLRHNLNFRFELYL